MDDFRNSITAICTIEKQFHYVLTFVAELCSLVSVFNMAEFKYSNHMKLNAKLQDLLVIIQAYHKWRYILHGNYVICTYNVKKEYYFWDAVIPNIYIKYFLCMKKYNNQEKHSTSKLDSK